MMEQGTFYRHSGAFSVAGLVVAAIAGTVGAAAAAVLYAVLAFYVPIAGLVTFVLAAGFGITAGWASGTALKWGKLRHDGLSMLLAGVFAAEAVYVSWAVWTAFQIGRSDAEASAVVLLSSPKLLWTVAREINEAGAWSIRGFRPTGGVLWALWGVEAAIVSGITFLVCMGMTAVPFCERCSRWCELEQDVARFAACDEDRVKSEGPSRPLDFLKSLGRPDDADDAWLRADLYACPSCRDTHTLSLSAVKLKPLAKEGERKESIDEVLRGLLVPGSVARGIRELARS